MRLTEVEVAIIKEAIRERFGDAGRIMLFRIARG